VARASSRASSARRPARTRPCSASTPTRICWRSLAIERSRREVGRTSRRDRPRSRPPTSRGDATRLPLVDDAVDLATCQALLINLPDPAAGVRELARVSGDLVAAVEPNNAEVAVSSTVDREADLEREARRAYLAGVDTDVALGDRVRTLFADEGLVDVRTRRYLHEKRTAPPYDDAALEAAARKASGSGLADHETELRAALSTAEYDDLRQRWRELGRDIITGIREESYERVELVPFEVTVGRVPDAS